MNDRVVVSSHQPHFFPWIGYLDKMAKSNIFLLNDVVPLETKSPMVRNKIIDDYGIERYINISVDKTGYTSKPNNQIFLSDIDNAKKRLTNIITNAYKNSPFFSEIWPHIERILAGEYNYLWEVDFATIQMLRFCFDIQTRIIITSQLVYDNQGNTKSDRLSQKVLACGGNVYLSGIGAKKYMEDDVFRRQGIKVIYQQFQYPVYKQVNSKTFVPNLSSLDMLFNCGIEQSKQLFWENVKQSKELEDDGPLL